MIESPSPRFFSQIEDDLSDASRPPSRSILDQENCSASQPKNSPSEDQPGNSSEALAGDLNQTDESQETQLGIPENSQPTIISSQNLPVSPFTPSELRFHRDLLDNALPADKIPMLLASNFTMDELLKIKDYFIQRGASTNGLIVNPMHLYPGIKIEESEDTIDPTAPTQPLGLVKEEHSHYSRQPTPPMPIKIEYELANHADVDPDAATQIGPATLTFDDLDQVGPDPNRNDDIEENRAGPSGVQKIPPVTQNREGSTRAKKRAHNIDTEDGLTAVSSEKIRKAGRSSETQLTNNITDCNGLNGNPRSENTCGGREENQCIQREQAVGKNCESESNKTGTGEFEIEAEASEHPNLSLDPALGDSTNAEPASSAVKNNSDVRGNDREVEQRPEMEDSADEIGPSDTESDEDLPSRRDLRPLERGILKKFPHLSNSPNLLDNFIVIGSKPTPDNFSCPCRRVLENQNDCCFVLLCQNPGVEAPEFELGSLCFGNFIQRLKGTPQGELAKLIKCGTSEKGINLKFKAARKNGVKHFQAHQTWFDNLGVHSNRLDETYSVLPLLLRQKKLTLVFDLPKMLHLVRLEQQYRVHFNVQKDPAIRQGLGLEFVRVKATPLAKSAAKFKSNSMRIQPTILDFFKKGTG